jgi:hypothetical protein
MSPFWKAVLGLVLVGSVAMSFFGPSKESSYLWDLPAFFAVYGFAGCVVIIYLSKAIGKYWLQRPDEYYDPYRAPAEVGHPAEGGSASGEGDAHDG